jgi:hypothetical protein
MKFWQNNKLSFKDFVTIKNNWFNKLRVAVTLQDWYNIRKEK